MLTRNFYSCYCIPRPDFFTDEGSMEENASKYFNIKNPEGKIMVTNPPTNTTKYVRGQYRTSNGLDYRIIGDRDYTSSSTSYENTLNLPKNDKDTTQTPAECFEHDRGYGLIFLGSGTTAPTYEDVCMENCITDYDRRLVSYSIDKKNLVMTISMKFIPTITLTVNEIGWYQTPVKGYNYTTGEEWTISRMIALCARTVLDSPATFEAGKTYAIDYQIDFKTMSDSVGGV